MSTPGICTPVDDLGKVCDYLDGGFSMSDHPLYDA